MIRSIQPCAALLACAFLFASPCLGDAYEDAFVRGREAMRARDYTAAAAAFERATELKPGEVDAWFRLGLARSAAQQADAAIAAYGKAAELDPAHAKARNNLGNVLFRRGDYDEALTWYERALAIDPDYMLALYHQGWILRHNNLNDEAEEAFGRCLTRTPASRREQSTWFDCQFFAGTMRFRAEDYAAAAAAMEKTLQANGGHVEARYYLGMSYRRLGRMEDARRQLEIHRELTRATRGDRPIEKAPE